jgi:hypothetical protein
MAVTIEQPRDRVVTVRVSGRVKSPEWSAAQQAVGKLMQSDPSTPVSILVIAEGFQGWEGTDWDDMSFQLEHDHQIDRMAIVAEKRWEDDVLMFSGKGLRRFPIRYFVPTELEQAREWLK